jgi:hypothetical protein
MTGKMDFDFFYNEDMAFGFDDALKARLTNGEAVTVKFCAPGVKILGGQQSCAPEQEKEILVKKQVVTIAADASSDERIDKAIQIMEMVENYKDAAHDRVFHKLGPAY